MHRNVDEDSIPKSIGGVKIISYIFSVIKWFFFEDLTKNSWNIFNEKTLLCALDGLDDWLDSKE